jgi:hypothetical protein
MVGCWVMRGRRPAETPYSVTAPPSKLVQNAPRFAIEVVQLPARWRDGDRRRGRGRG